TMCSYHRRIQLAIQAVVLLCVTAGASCSQTHATAPNTRTHVRLAWPSSGLFGTELAAAYERSTDVDVAIVEDANSLGAVEEGRADITVTLADMAYFAYRDSPRLRSIAALEVIPLQVVVRKDAPIERLSDFRGHSLALPGGGPTRATSLVFDAAGLTGKVNL